MSACNGRTEEPANPSEQSITDDGSPGVLVYETDSTEWRVKIFKEHLLYSEAVAVKLPAPWRLPVKTEAQLLRTLEYASPSGEHFGRIYFRDAIVVCLEGWCQDEVLRAGTTHPADYDRRSLLKVYSH